MKYNFIIDVDSYKNNHGIMLKDGVEYLQSSIIARKCNGDIHTNVVIPFGYVYAIKEYLSKPITKADIDEAEKYFLMHGEIKFDRSRWEYIVDNYDGYLPLKINAVKEGIPVNIGMPIVRVENTDKNCAWLVSYIETMLLRAVWYGTTVATDAYSIRKIFEKTMEHQKSSNIVDFHLHNFGARGGTSHESEIISSMAHAISFSGSDSMLVNRAINEYYPSANGELKPYCFSVTASEHSVSCSNSDYENRDDFAMAVKMLDICEEQINYKENNNLLYYVNDKGEKQISTTIISIVIDTYDAYRFAREYIGERLKDRVIALSKRGAKIVLRPDSGNPLTMPIEIINILMEKFGYKTTAAGYKTLPDFLGVLQGDGVNAKSIQDIINNLEKEKLSLNNLIFGMGGKLVVPTKGRDTYSFAMKATAQKLKDSDVWQPLIKDPITDIGKKSLSGYITTVMEKGVKNPKFLATEINVLNVNNHWVDAMVEVFNNGKVIEDNIHSFDEIRLASKV